MSTKPTPRTTPSTTERHSLSPIEKFGTRHDVTKFRCGKDSLDDFLKRYALKNQGIDSSQTYVAHRDGIVVAYYSLSFGGIQCDECPESVRAGMPKYDIPVMVLARLAVDEREQGSGLGEALLKDAFMRIVSAAEIAGLRAVLVHALDDKAREFYRHFGFQDCPTGERQLMMPIQDIRATMAAAEIDAGEPSAGTRK